MPPIKCSYSNCNNTSKDFSLFRFPTGHASRLAVWLSNCGNMAITHLSRQELRNRYLCNTHFEDKFIHNKTGKRKRLSKMAVPQNYNDEQFSAMTSHSPCPSTSQAQETSPALKVLTPTKVYKTQLISNNKNIEEGTELDAPLSFDTPKKRKSTDTPKCKRLKMSLRMTSKLLKREKTKYNRLKRKICSKTNNLIDLKKHHFKSDASKILTVMQVKKTKRQWSEAEKNFCLSLYYKSPAAYKHLLNTGIVLASPTTIQHWLQSSSCLPGLSEDVFKNIEKKFCDQPINYRACGVCLDEMSIMADLEYTKKYDLIEGFEDFGDGERSPKEAKYALVFVARGIYANWKMPLAYFLSHKNVNADKLVLIIKKIINILFESGLLPKVIICDQATTNVKAIKSLGATKDEPFFFIDDRKIYSIFDVPHLIKNIRNNLIDNNYYLNGNEISFNDIINVYNIDKNNKSKSLQKLTPVHLKPNNFQKMKVKFATQIFSNSVAAAIETVIASGELKSDTAKHTADFVKIINDLFDSLNSKNKFDKNPFKCAITKNRNSYVNKTLIRGLEIFSDLKKKMIKDNEPKLTRPPCFDGIVQTINAVLQLSTEEFSAGTEVRFLMTYRLNQDVLENLFGIFRIRGGCNRNPTSRNLRAMFRSHLLNNLIKLNNTNCESDQDTFMSTPAENQQQNTQLSTPSLEDPRGIAGPSNAEPSGVVIDLHLEGADKENVQVPNVISDGAPPEITLETCSIVYFAGWLGKVCVENFDCIACKSVLINNEVDLTDKKQLLLINKTYSNLITPSLKSPSDFLYDLVKKMLHLFNDSIGVIHKINLLSDLMEKSKTNLPNDYHDFNHIDFLIRKLFEVKIYDYCKSRKKLIDPKSKIRILQNK